MDGLYCQKASADPNIYLIMDNDSGYISNNLDHESNSDSILDNSDTSTVDILRSFLPKPVYLSEDALLECPNIELHQDNAEIGNYKIDSVDECVYYSPDLIVQSSVRSEKTYPGLPSFSSFRSDTEVSDSSLVIPIIEPIYIDLKNKVYSCPTICPKRYDNEDTNIEVSDNSAGVFFGFETEQRVNIFKSAVLEKVHEDQNFLEIKADTKEQAKSTIEKVVELSHNSPVLQTSNEPKRVDLKGDKFSDVSNSLSLSKSEKKCVDIHASPKKSVQMASSSNDVKITFHTPRKMGSENVLSNVTNTCDKTDKVCNQMEATSKICVRRRTTSSKDKENISEVEVFKTRNRGLKRKFNETASPDLFSDGEGCKPNPLPSPKVIEERFVHKLDQGLLKRVQRELSGVPPPPDFTIIKLTVDDILQKLETNKSYFWTSNDCSKSEVTNSEKDVSKSLSDSKNCSFGCGGSILIEGNLDEAINKEFPNILYSRHHGLHYNRNRLSEEIEHLCDKYAKRYIGAETQSTCCAVEPKYVSPAKRRGIKNKWASKSPGRRLSHLARRRITFSSANLQAGSSSSAASRARQILIDYKKLELLNHKKSPIKTPKKALNKSPSEGRTPSSSAKKKLRMRFRLLSGDFKEGTAGPSSSVGCSKRALFQSPDSENKYRNILSNSSTSSCSTFNSDLNSRGPKRSLFPSPNKIGCKSSLFSSPKKKSPFKNLSYLEKKRKRELADDASSNPLKFFRSQSMDMRSSENEQKANASFSRSSSDCALSLSQPLTDLSAAHKKKLQWAVYESLKLQNISTSHPQFKTYASVLARVTRRCILSSGIRQEGGTSERMLRIAKRHSFAVVKGKSVEEIMTEHNRNRPKTSKPQGYIAPEDYQRCKELSVNRDSALKDKSNTGDFLKNSNSRPGIVKLPESRIDRIRKVINFEDNR